MRIGIVDVDTSHPRNWIPIERDLGHEIVGLWDGGSVHSPEYVRSFAGELEVPKIYPALDDMVGEVDCAIVHGADWDTHIAKARPFIEAGKAVLIDKPLAGNERDLRQIQAWADAGARITGGSSLRFCGEVREWLAQPAEERGTPATVFCGCGTDNFNYGIHAYSLLSGLMGPGAESVRWICGNRQDRIEVRWPEDRVGFLAVGAPEPPAYMPFHATVVTEKGVTPLRPDAKQLYRSMLEIVLPYLSGEQKTQPVETEALLETERIALAARCSMLEEGRAVRLDELEPGGPGYDGAAFAAAYSKQHGK